MNNLPQEGLGKFLFRNLIAWISLLFFVQASDAQITQTIVCSGVTGSFKSGSVNAAGIKNDGQMISLNSSNNRGWATFDLSSIPSGSLISSVNLQFTTYSSISSTVPDNICYGFTGDPASMTGPELYAACTSGTSLNVSGWAFNALNTRSVSALGRAFITLNIGGIINVGYVRGSINSNTYNIHGYSGTVAPALVITYTTPTICSGIPAPGITIGPSVSCSGAQFTLSISGTFVNIGNITYQWESADDIGFTSNIVDLGTSNTQLTSISSNKYFRCLVSCTSSGLSAYSTPLLVSLNNIMSCLCTTYPTSASNEEITNVTFGPLNNSSACLTLAPGPGSLASRYSNYKSGTGAPTAPWIPLGFSIPFSFTQTSCNASFNNRFYCWIDFNQDGDYLDAGENVYEGEPVLGNHTDIGSILIPTTALAGTTSMRVMNIQVSSLGTCQTFTSGEVEDYSIYLYWNEICIFGPPYLGPTTGPSIACSNIPFNLNLQNALVGTSPLISYLWQSADDSAFTINISNLGTAPTQSTSQSSSKYYRCVTTCTYSNTSYYSTPLFVETVAWPNCYNCPANSTNGTISGFYTVISNVTFDAINNTTTYPISSPFYTYYPNLVAQLAKGQTTFVTVTHGSSSKVAAWIDFDHSGTFDASEYTFIGNSSSSGNITQTVGITVPNTALSGYTKMRFRSEYSAYPLVAAQACTLLNYGETEDYLVYIAELLPCTGTPNPGNTIASTTLGCVGHSVNLTLQNTTTLGANITYQWYNNSGIIAGATNNVCTTLITSVNSYYCAVTCNNSALTVNSNPVSIPLNNFMNCYCSSSATTVGEGEIYQVTLNGNSTHPLYANAIGCNNVAPGPGSILSRYANFKTLPSLASLAQGVNANYQIRINECNGSPYYMNGVAIFIDWNQDGDFTDPQESIFKETVESAANGNSPSPYGDKVVSGLVSVPNNALLGQTVMRVICAGGYSGSALSPCLNYNYGETEDYMIEVISNLACIGIPVPGNTLSSSNPVCPNSAVTLSLSDPSLILTDGLTYQWYNSLGIIAGETNNTYTAIMNTTNTYYCNVTCTNSGLTASSSPITITLDNPLICYCSAGANAHCIGGGVSAYINNTSFNTINNSTSCGVNYSNHTNLQSDIIAGLSYSCSVSVLNWSSADKVSVWIDFNKDGDLVDIGEQFNLINGSNASTPFTGMITIPSNASYGKTLMRVRCNYNQTMSPCGNTSYGEVEDYALDIHPPSILNLKLFYEGYWNGVAMNSTLFNQSQPSVLNACDTIGVELRSLSNPTVIAYSTKAVLFMNGIATATFPYAINGNYFIVISHRNGLQTWSANAIQILSNTNYDFTTASNKAYGSNQIEIESGVWAFYSGDLNADENIDLLDASILEADISSFQFGYFATDLNGDGNVDLLDIPIVENNINSFIFANHP